MPRTNMTPPLTDESMENKLISLALRQAQKQLEEGSASSQIITHFLRLASTRAQIELEKLELENKLLQEKILSEQSGQEIRDKVGEVLEALRSYTYLPPGGDDADIF